MADKYRIGVLGTGRMATSFVAGMADAEDACIYAVGSRSQATATRFAEKQGLQRAHSSYANLVADPDVDIIYVATPHSLHRDNCLDAIDAGKAVLCEKPFTINADEARDVIYEARSSRRFVMEAMWTRFLPSMVELRRLLESETIGEIQTVIGGGAFMPPFDEDSYLFNRSLGGGVMLDAGVYLVSLASMILGEPESVRAVGRVGQSGVDESDGVLLGHCGGASALLYVSLRAQEMPDMKILGSKGSIHLHGPIFAPEKLTLSLYDEGDSDIDLPVERNGYQYQVSHVVECLRSGNPESDVMPLDESLQIMQTMDEIREQIGVRYPQDT